MSAKFELLHEVAGPRKVPVITLQRDGLQISAPRIIVLHGLRGHKEKYLEELYEFAKRGYRASAVDLFLHGEHDQESSLNERIEVDFTKTILDIVYETAADLSSLLDMWVVGPVQIGVMGISAGGLAAHALNVSDRRISAHVSIISSPDWNTADAHTRLDVQSLEYKHLAGITPSAFPEKYLSTALLMLVAADDQIVSPEGSYLLFDRLKPMYADRDIEDRLSLMVFEDNGHAYTGEMRRLAFDWFSRHLTTPHS